MLMNHAIEIHEYQLTLSSHIFTLINLKYLSFPCISFSQRIKNMDSSIASGDLLKVYNGILDSIKDIADHLRYNTSNKITASNDFGDV